MLLHQGYPALVDHQVQWCMQHMVGLGPGDPQTQHCG